jgi:hypothetical protein
VTDGAHTRGTFAAGLAVSVVCIGIELLVLLRGVTLFAHRLNVIHAVAHSAGAVSLAFFLLDRWPASSYWGIFAFCRWAVDGHACVCVCACVCLIIRMNCSLWCAQCPAVRAGARRSLGKPTEVTWPRIVGG